MESDGPPTRNRRQKASQHKSSDIRLVGPSPFPRFKQSLEDTVRAQFVIQHPCSNILEFDVTVGRWTPLGQILTAQDLPQPAPVPALHEGLAF